VRTYEIRSLANRLDEPGLGAERWQVLITTSEGLSLGHQIDRDTPERPHQDGLARRLDPRG
jgi:hypothetical protein